MFTTLGAEHALLDNDVICFFVFNFQISPAYNYTTFTDIYWGETRNARVDKARRLHQLLLHNTLEYQDSTDLI
jgi:hypothetical protein